VQIISNLINSVQSVKTFQESQKRRKENQNNQHAAKKHEKTAAEMAEVISFLQTLPVDETGLYIPSLIEASQESSAENSDLFSFSESDISDLPVSLVNSLKLSPGDKLEGKILELLKIANRPLNIRELIIGLYKKYQHEVTDRNPFASKLSRMSNAGKVVSVHGKKGYYTLPENDELFIEDE